MPIYTESRTHLHNHEKALGWQTAIDDANLEIKKCQRRIANLQTAIKVFRQRLKEGEPWPGNSEKK